ncbi:MAG TPA: CRISPR-associated endoribonuclease Cas6 [Clostridia bacterium]
MRLKCDFISKEIPSTYNLMFVSLIKQALKESDEDYFQKIYFFDGKANKKSKDFCFSVQLKSHDFEENIAKLKEGGSFVVSSPNKEFIIHLYNGLLKIEDFKYKGFSLKRGKMSLVKDKLGKIDSNEMLFATMSPFCVKRKDGYYMKLEDEGFQEELNYIAGLVLENYRGFGLAKEIEFQEVKMRKVVVREEINGFEEMTKKKYMYVNSYEGVFKLCGDERDLKDLYELGLGFRRNQGFGMMDVVY